MVINSKLTKLNFKTLNKNNNKNWNNYLIIVDLINFGFKTTIIRTSIGITLKKIVQYLHPVISMKKKAFH